MVSETQQKKMCSDTECNEDEGGDDDDNGMMPGFERTVLTEARETRCDVTVQHSSFLSCTAIEHLRPRSPLACVHFPQTATAREGGVKGGRQRPQSLRAPVGGALFIKGHGCCQKDR